MEALNVHPGGLYVDCTLGGGGHARAILERSQPDGRLLALDADPAAVDVAKGNLAAYESRVVFINENFRRLKEVCNALAFRPVDGILFDLGLSSLQLQDVERGFSFKLDAPLDMRYDPRQPQTAADLVNYASEEELSSVLARYGEEPRHRLLARRITANRPIRSAAQLASIVEDALGRTGRIHPATRTFQALRIATNEELVSLKEALQQTVDLLEPGGRLAVISYHSLEDRIVKDFLRQESVDCLCPPELPVCRCQHKASLRIVTKRAVRPSFTEVQANPRSRSAKLRAAERLPATSII